MEQELAVRTSRVASATSPAVSVVIPLRNGWPAARFVLEPLLPQVRALEAEVLVVDGSGRAPPPRNAFDSRVTWLARPGASVFQLCAAGIAAAHGSIVALTEDHCRVREDWLASIVRAFEERPEAVAIGGAVENGTPWTTLDQASYLITKAIFTAPLPKRQRQITSESNVAYRRSALEGISDGNGLGVLMLAHNVKLRARGEVLLLDDRIVVAHHQSFPFLKTSGVHFHDGRVIAGFARGHMGARDRVRLAVWPALPIFRAARTVATALGRGQDPGTVLRALPYILWLQYCHAMGTALGYLTGVGQSPRKLH